MFEMLQEIEAKIRSGERLSREDGLLLAKSSDLLYLGSVARYVKRQKTGMNAYFNVNYHVNLTNVCVSKCKFCAFGRDHDAQGAYVMTRDEVLERVAANMPSTSTELHIVSALHPELTFDYYCDIIRTLNEKYPHIHIQAFTAVEIDYFAQLTGKTIEDVLKILKEAGLGSLPGGGAEVFSSRVRQELCPKKADGERWLEVMETAHKLGLRSNATMLFGHMENWEERIDHLIRLRELQDKTGGFQSFIPLPFHPENTELAHLSRTSAVEELKVIAISRLMLDNFDHVKAFWIMLGLPIAQLSLEFGVDDLDGTVVEEKITHAAGAKTAQGISKEDLLAMIREMGHVPVERDTLYNVIKVYQEE